jgi:hypothetical protein
MTQLHIFMELDTCPMCERKICVTDDNPYVGLKLSEVPNDAVFEIVCTDETGTNLTCGKFIVKKKDQTSPDNDWVCEYLPVDRDW